MNINQKLIHCAKVGDLAGVKEAIEKGANIHSIDDYALRLTAYNNHLEVVKYLIRNGADVFVNNQSVLYWSKSRGNSEVVKYIEMYIKLKSL